MSFPRTSDLSRKATSASLLASYQTSLLKYRKLKESVEASSEAPPAKPARPISWLGRGKTGGVSLAPVRGKKRNFNIQFSPKQLVPSRVLQPRNKNLKKLLDGNGRASGISAGRAEDRLVATKLPIVSALLGIGCTRSRAQFNTDTFARGRACISDASARCTCSSRPENVCPVVPASQKDSERREIKAIDESINAPCRSFVTYRR